MVGEKLKSVIEKVDLELDLLKVGVVVLLSLRFLIGQNI